MPHRQQYLGSSPPRYGGGSTPHSPVITTSAPPPTPNIQVSSSISSFAMMCPPEAMAAVAAVEASQSADVVQRRELDRAKRERYFKKLSDLVNEQRLIEQELESMDQQASDDDNGGLSLMPPPFDLPPSQQQPSPPHNLQQYQKNNGPSRTSPTHHHHRHHSPLHHHADSVLQRLGASLQDDGYTHTTRDTANRTANRFLYQTTDNCEMTAHMEHTIEELVGQMVHSTPLIRPPSSLSPQLNAHPNNNATTPPTHPTPNTTTTTNIGASSNIFDVLMSVSGAPNNESTELVLIGHSPTTDDIPPTSEEKKDRDDDELHHAIVTTTPVTTPPTSQQPRPFPYRAVSVLALVMFNESLAFTMSIPFIGLFVAHLQGISPDDAGYTSGFLVGSFMFGQVISGKYWGQFSDSYGRKPAMMTGLFLGGVFVTLFGLSTSIYMAMIVRLMHGVCFGNCLVAKAMIAEVIEEKDQAIGFSIVSITWSSGTMLGPAIGGFLYNPTRYFDPDTSVPLMGPDSVLATYPALFPSALCAIYSLVALVCVELLLTETNQFAKPLPTVTEMTRHVSGKAKKTWKNKAKYVSSLSPTASILRGEGTTTKSNIASPTTTNNNNTATFTPTTTTPTTVNRNSNKAALRSFDSYNELAESNNDKDVVVETSGGGEDGQFTNYPEITEDDADNKISNGTRTVPIMGSSAPSNSRRVEHGVNRWVEDQVSASVSPSLLPSANPHTRPLNKPGSSATVTQAAPPPPPASSRGTIIYTARTESDTVTFADEDRLGGSHTAHHPNEDDNDTASVDPTAPPVVAGFGYSDAFRNPATRMAISLYMIICFCEIAFLEILPLWAVASISSGGLGLQSDDVAIIVGLSSISGLIANILFPKIIQQLKGPLSLFPLAVLLWAIPSLIVPSLTRYLNVYSSSSTTEDGGDILQQQTSSTFWIIATVVIITIPRSFGEGWGFSIVFIMTARAAPPGAMGAMTGIAQSLGAALRCLAPLISAPLFAWSISSPGRSFPLDESFAFLVASIPMFCCIPVGRALEAYLDTPRTHTTSTTSALEYIGDGGDDDDIIKQPPTKTTTTTSNNNKHALIAAPDNRHGGENITTLSKRVVIRPSSSSTTIHPQRYGVEDCRMEEDILQSLPTQQEEDSGGGEGMLTTAIPAGYTTLAPHITTTTMISSVHPPGEVIVDQLNT